MIYNHDDNQTMLGNVWSCLAIVGYFFVTGSGVVGWERMTTAFPHKKLSGNGVPTREILRDILLLLLLN